jgi:hypothetical protein
VGYEVIRVPLDRTGHASGEYEDFLTGFVLPDGKVWGRPRRHNHGFRWIAAGERRRIRLGVESSLHGEVTGTLPGSYGSDKWWAPATGHAPRKIPSPS